MQICYGAKVGLGRMTAHALSSPKRTGRVSSAREPSKASSAFWSAPLLDPSRTRLIRRRRRRRP